MKKTIIALMGLFTLFACSEDAYRETDKLTETGTVENNSDGGMMPLTVSLYYNSPFQPYGSGFNKDIVTTFRNTTPFFLELTPYGEDMHVQTFLSAHSIPYPPLPNNTPPFSFKSGTNFTIPPGAVYINQDPGAPMSVNIPPYSNPQGAVVYDFTDPSVNWRMYHYGKIYYFYFKVFDNIGRVIEEGIIKHKFHNDDNDYNEITTSDSDWQLVTDEVPDLSPYEVVVMYHTIWDEMCLTNKNKVSDPLLSEVIVTDPTTGTAYTLEFDSDINGVYVNFF